MLGLTALEFLFEVFTAKKQCDTLWSKHLILGLTGMKFVFLYKRPI